MLLSWPAAWAAVGSGAAAGVATAPSTLPFCLPLQGLPRLSRGAGERPGRVHHEAQAATPRPGSLVLSEQNPWAWLLCLLRLSFLLLFCKKRKNQEPQTRGNETEFFHFFVGL